MIELLKAVGRYKLEREKLDFQRERFEHEKTKQEVEENLSPDSWTDGVSKAIYALAQEHSEFLAWQEEHRAQMSGEEGHL